MTRALRAVTLLLALAAAAAPIARAQPARARATESAPSADARAATGTEPGSELVVTLITFGLGEQVFERFGHNALWVHDAALGTDVAYDWGNFDFAQPAFLRRFLTGDTR